MVSCTSLSSRSRPRLTDTHRSSTRSANLSSTGSSSDYPSPFQSGVTHPSKKARLKNVSVACPNFAATETVQELCSSLAEEFLRLAHLGIPFLQLFRTQEVHEP